MRALVVVFGPRLGVNIACAGHKTATRGLSSLVPADAPVINVHFSCKVLGKRSEVPGGFLQRILGENDRWLRKFYLSLNFNVALPCILVLLPHVKVTHFLKKSAVKSNSSLSNSTGGVCSAGKVRMNS